ncbi:S-adenosyl-L-methionine-dependent methyltransferase [Neolentinus lepideus HHB14362 ss-1]|uniref:Trimethylguanosine synthase n=1 Tax=Neolentinus lepideus HHB14362 ss-1 TaxID=1314782 RepID=A0A165SKP8_9AGAM|nr:S-adenosyl-L-methionine-dependent methyltransferase [Neolentinus lepideus HHB14362 ss-1]
MGKKRGVSGLSGFAREAFGSQSQFLSTEASQSSQSPDDSFISTQRNQPSGPNTTSQEPTLPPLKRRKVGLLGPGQERYDATELVPFYTDEDEVPDELRKYFSQRLRLFSLYDSGALLDHVGWFSVTPEAIAANIAERCRCDVILDAFCGVGGNAIQFAMRCERVIALDTSLTRLRLARHNAVLYGVADRIEFILADYVEFAKSYTSRNHSMQDAPNYKRKIDVVFLSPPWGGPGYIDGGAASAINQLIPPTPTPREWDTGKASTLDHPSYSLSDIQPIPGKDIFALTRQITKNVAYYLPRNVQLEEVSALVSDEKGEMVEVEEQWMGSKLKAVCCYFGGLVSGQEEMW